MVHSSQTDFLLKLLSSKESGIYANEMGINVSVFDIAKCLHLKINSTAQYIFQAISYPSFYFLALMSALAFKQCTKISSVH